MSERESFGQYLRTQREKKGIRLEEIASITKIHLRNLEHLENNHWNQLPPDPFLRGFIVAYAKYIGLDQKEAIQKFLEETQPQSLAAATNGTEGVTSSPAIIHTPKESPASKPIPRPTELIEGSRNFPFGKLLAGVGVAAVVALFIFITRVGQRASGPNSAEVPVAAETGLPKASAPVVTEPSAPETAASTTTEIPALKAPEPAPVAAVNPEAAVPSDVSHEILIEGKERTWIKVVFDKEQPVEYFLPEGEKVTYRAKDKIKIVLGNSTGTKVVHNGTAVPGTKLQGTIRQYLFPSDARFPQDAASRRSPSSRIVDGAKVETQPEEKKPETTPTTE